MIKYLLHSKEKELKKAWPENCPWSKPKYYGIKYDEDLDFDGRDEGIRDLFGIKEYYDSLVQGGILNWDYTLHKEEEDFFPEMGEDYWNDGFDIEAWREDLSAHVNLLHIPNDKAVNELSKVFSYKFNNENLLRQAFTRRAFQIEYGLDSCSEELEFLGDSILSTVVTKEMFKQLTNHDCISFDSPFRSRYDEGELTKIRQKFVSKEALAARARELGLGKYVLYGTGEQETDSSLEDMMEALIGAAVLDSEWDMQAIEKLVDELVCIQFDKSDDLLEKSNYDELNRWHQKHFGCIPTYKVHDEGNGWYLCEITYNVPGNPTANSLKADGKTRGSAREEAANKVVNLLMYYGLWKNLSEAHIEPDLENSINQLQELYQKKYLDEKPEYEYKDGGNEWLVTCHADGFYGYGKASTKVMAKKNAAYMLLCKMIKK